MHQAADKEGIYQLFLRQEAGQEEGPAGGASSGATNEECGEANLIIDVVSSHDKHWTTRICSSFHGIFSIELL